MSQEDILKNIEEYHKLKMLFYDSEKDLIDLVNKDYFEEAILLNNNSTQILHNLIKLRAKLDGYQTS